MRDKYLELLGGGLLWALGQGSIRLYEWNLKGSAAGCLLVVKGSGEGKFWVTFVGGRSPEKVLEAFLERLRTKTIEWRPDKYRSTIGEK